MERNAYESEVKLTDKIFNLLGKYKNFEIDFSDNGREIFLTDTKTNECFTITVTQDE